MATRSDLISDDVFNSFLNDQNTPAISQQTLDSIGTGQADIGPPRTFVETVGRGASSGLSGLQSGGKYFNAIFNTIVGDTEAANEAIAEARIYEEEAGRALKNIEQFSEFKENPTFSGAITQFGVGVGQGVASLVPVVAGALATGGTSVVASLLGRGVLTAGSRLASKKVIKQSAENVAKGVGTKAEKELIDTVYEGLKGFTFKRGAYAGAFGAGYVPLSGQNFAEGLESGRESDTDLAFRSLAVGAPQAALEIATPLVLLKSLSKVAKAKSVGDGSIMGGLVKDIGKGLAQGGVTELATETGQEGIAILNRMDMDPTFTSEEAQLRLAEAAFKGFSGGVGIGGIGGTMTGTVRATKRIFDNAQEKVEAAKEQQADVKDSQERYGNVNTGKTTPESDATLFAQLEAMLNPKSDKKAVWAAGKKPPSAPEDGGVGKLKLKGKEIFYGYMPGKGTIYGDEKTVREVVADGATDRKLTEVLGYSNVKPDDADLVVQALDENNVPISEELTNKEGEALATEVAVGLSPVNKTRTISLDEALAERKKRFDGKATEPTVRGMDINEETQEQELQQAGIVEETDLLDETQVVATGTVKQDPEAVFDNTESARQSFIEQFGQTDFTDPFYAGMTEAFLTKVAREKSDTPDTQINIDLEDGKYVARKQDASSLSRQDVIKALNKATRSKREFKTGAFFKTPDGETKAINLANLVTAGKNLLRSRGIPFDENSKEGARLALTTFLADMQLAAPGYDIVIGNSNASIFDVNLSAGRLEDQIDTQVVAAVIDGGKVTLGQLFDSDTKESAKPYVVVRRDIFQKEKDAARFATLAEAEKHRTELLATYPAEVNVEIVDRSGFVDPTDNMTDPLAEGVGETQMFAEQTQYDADGPIPKTRLNLEMDPNKDIYKFFGKTTRPARANTKPLYPVGTLGSVVTDILTTVHRSIRPKKSVFVLGVKQMNDMTDAEIRQMFRDPNVANLVKEQYEKLKSSSVAVGRYIDFPDGHVILLDNTKGNDLQTALVGAHEMGHILFNEEMNNSLAKPVLRDKLMKAFEKARQAKDAPPAYNDQNNERGFEEWYADQVAIWAKAAYFKERKPATGIVSRTFKAIGEQLAKMWQRIDSRIRQRFDKKNRSERFTDYIDNVVITQRKNLAQDASLNIRDLSYRKKALVRQMELPENGKARQAVSNMMGGFAKLFDNPKGHTLLKVILPEDNMLRKISPTIANMFYVRSNDVKGNKVGFIKSKDHVRGQVYNELEDMLGTDWSTQEVQDAFQEAASGTPTAELKTEKGKAIRNFLERLYDNYINKVPNNQIGKRENYFPVALDLAKIYRDPDAFIDMIVANKPGVQRADIVKVVDGLIKRQQHILLDGEITFDVTDPISYVERARELTEGISPDLLQPFTEPPETAILKYVRHIITHTEFKRYTQDENGNNILDQELEKLAPAKRKEALSVIERYLGYTNKPLNPGLQKLNSYLQLFNWVTLLPLATIGSIPELGGAIVNTREFNGITMALKAINTNIENRQQAIQLARSLGVAFSTTMGNLGLTDADAEYLDPKVRKWSDKFFQRIGLDWYTRFTREFASVMGVEFIKTHADPNSTNTRSERYLKDHGLTADQVNAWLKNQDPNSNYNFDGPEGEAVKAGLQRFVENSMLRPNAAERTSWGNDPRYQLIWALKSYLYSFGKVIIGGLKREMGKRLAEGGAPSEKYGAVAMTGLLAAAAFMPLAMMSLELRELAKAGIAGVLPGVEANAKYFRSDRMDWGEYFVEMFDRAGLAGPMSIIGMAFKSVEWGKTPFGAIFGPTVGLLVDDIGMGLYQGKGWEVVPARIIPGYSLVL